MTMRFLNHIDADLTDTMICDINRDCKTMYEPIAFEELPEADELREIIKGLAVSPDLLSDHLIHADEEARGYNSYDVWLDGFDSGRVYEFTLELQYGIGVKYTVQRIAVYEGDGAKYYQLAPELTGEDKNFDCAPDSEYIEVYS